MTGSWARTAIRLAAAIAAGLLAAAFPGAASASSGTSGVTCEYIVLNSWSGGFTADLRIVNDGPTIDGWTVRWTAPVPTSNVLGWAARMTQRGSEITAVNWPWNAVIPTGEARTFGWSATAPSTEAPDDITINGAPC